MLNNPDHLGANTIVPTPDPVAAHPPAMNKLAQLARPGLVHVAPSDTSTGETPDITK